MEEELTKREKIDKKALMKSFLIKSIILFVVWKIVFHALIIPSGKINLFLTKAVSYGTMLGGRLIGYDTKVEMVLDGSPSCIVHFDEQPAVLVADPCNGLEMFALYIGFLICFPGRLGPKVLFSLAGTLLLFLANIVREVFLAFNYIYFRWSFDFNHKYTYAIALYVLVFVLWKYWLNHYSSLASTKDES